MVRVALIIIVFWVDAFAHPRLAPATENQPGADTQILSKMVDLYRRGRFSTCASLAGSMNTTRLLNPDAAMFVACQCLFFARDTAKAYTCYANLLQRYPKSCLATLSAYKKADCLAVLGKKQPAFEAYRKASKSAQDPRVDPVVGWLVQIRALRRSGHFKQAENLLEKLYSGYSEHPLIATRFFKNPDTKIEFRLGLRMASDLHRKRKWEYALRVLNGLPDPQSDPDRGRLAYLTGRILFDMRDRYLESYRMLSLAQTLTDDEDLFQRAWFYASRALGRLDRDAEAVENHLKLVEKYPRGKYSGQALMFAGWLELNRGRCERASPLLMRVWREYPRTTWADQARWFVAWCHLRAEKWEEVIETLRPNTAFLDAAVGAQADYWSGVAAKALDQTDRAEKFWTKAIRKAPLSWYALLAAARLGRRFPVEKKPTFLAPASVLSGAWFERAQELFRVGLYGMSVRLLRQKEKSWIAAHRSDHERYAFMRAYHQIGDYHRPWLLAVTRDSGRLRQLPDKKSLVVWEYAYPSRVVDWVKKTTGVRQTLARFLSAVMRTESGFDPLARSVADARGLMQLTPETAEKIALQMGIDYQDGDLFDPQYNLRMAAWYLERLVEMFRGQWPLAASAYNAGSAAMKSWCKQNGHLQLDAFVEAIPWSESRRYAKRVTAAFARFAYLNGSELPRLSLKVNPDYLENGLKD